MAMTVTDSSGFSSALGRLTDILSSGQMGAVEADLARHKRDGMVADAAAANALARERMLAGDVTSYNLGQVKEAEALGLGGDPNALWRAMLTLDNSGKVAQGNPADVASWTEMAMPDRYNDAELSRIRATDYRNTPEGVERGISATMATELMKMYFGGSGTGGDKNEMDITPDMAGEHGNAWRQDVRRTLEQQARAQGIANPIITDQMVDEAMPEYGAAMARSGNALGGGQQMLDSGFEIGARPNPGGFLGIGAGNEVFQSNQTVDPNAGKQAEMMALINALMGAGATMPGMAQPQQTMEAPREVTATEQDPKTGQFFTIDENGNSVPVRPGDMAGDPVSGQPPWVFTGTEWKQMPNGPR